MNFSLTLSFENVSLRNVLSVQMICRICANIVHFTLSTCVDKMDSGTYACYRDPSVFTNYSLRHAQNILCAIN